jgi:hypothetical protein
MLSELGDIHLSKANRKRGCPHNHLPLSLPWGCAEAGESGRSVKPLSMIECVRITPSPQNGDVAQLVRAGLLYSQGRGFNSYHPYKGTSV